MKKTLKNIQICLFNESGGNNVEQVMGIAISLAVGAGLFVFGRYVYQWYDGCAGETVDQIAIPGPYDYRLQ